MSGFDDLIFGSPEPEKPKPKRKPKAKKDEPDLATTVENAVRKVAAEMAEADDDDDDDDTDD